jgi:hypothetical protein
MKNIFSKIIICFFLVLVYLGFTSVAMAASTGNLGILPAYPDPERSLTKSWFLYEIDRGKKKRDAVKIMNSSNETKVVKVYPVDAVNTREGSFALLDESSPREGIGKWIKMASETLEIPAKSAKLVPFDVAVPEDAEVGDHLGGIAVQEVNPRNTLTGTGVNIVSRVGVRIYETIPGEIKKDLEISNFDWKLAPKQKKNWLANIFGLGKRVLFEANIANTGNVRISTEAKIEVKNIFGWNAVNLNDDSHRVLFPKGSQTELLFWEKMPLAGRYSAILTISALAPDGSSLDSRTKEISFWVFPWQFLLAIFSIAAIFSIIFFILRYWQKILRKNFPVYEVGGKESLRDIGKMFGTSWQKIAAANNLKKPYSIEKGDLLRIPVYPKKGEFNPRMSDKFNKMSPEGWQKLKRMFLARRITLVALAVIISAGAIIFWQVSKKMGAGSQGRQVQSPKNESGEETESSQLTKTGALKKSAVSVSVLAPSGADPVSSQRLVRKLELIGYKLESVSLQRSDYKLTTIEYQTGKKEIAEMVREDIGVSEPVNLVEKNNLAKDIIIWNFTPRSEFLEI